MKIERPNAAEITFVVIIAILVSLGVSSSLEKMLGVQWEPDYELAEPEYTSTGGYACGPPCSGGELHYTFTDEQWATWLEVCIQDHKEITE